MTNVQEGVKTEMEVKGGEFEERAVMGEGRPFIFPAEQTILSGRPKGAELLDGLMEHIMEGEDQVATPLDFSHISFMDVSCADEMLNKLLLRLRSGEMGKRYVYLRGLNTSVLETIEAVLHLRDLSVLVQDGEEVRLLGKLKRPMREVLEVLLMQKCVTSGEVSTALGKNVNIVCNRLNALQRMGLVCRLRDGSVEGGGRQYYYVSLL
jgi:hypothetical protein